MPSPSPSWLALAERRDSGDAGLACFLNATDRPRRSWLNAGNGDLDSPAPRVALAHQRLRGHDGGGVGGDVHEHRGRGGRRPRADADDDRAGSSTAPDPAVACSVRTPDRATGRRMSLASRVSTLAALVLLAASGIARADVPKAEDIAACNAEAKEATRKGEASRGASPNTDDH